MSAGQIIIANLRDQDDVRALAMVSGDMLQMGASGSFIKRASSSFALVIHQHALNDITDAGSAAAYDVGTNDGEIALLGAGGKLPTSTIPVIATNERVPVEDEAEMLALSTAQVQIGDLAVWSTGEIYMLVNTDPSDIGSWRIQLPLSGGVISVDGQTGTVVLSAVYAALSDFTTLQSSVTSLSGTVTTHTSQISTLTSTTGTHTTQISTLQSDLTSLTTTVGGHTTQISTLISDLNTAESNIGGLDSRLDTVESTLSGFGNVVTRDVGLDENDVPILGPGGVLPSSVFPALVMGDTFVVDNEAEMLALSAQHGDIAIRNDNQRNYILSGSDPSELTDWQIFATPAAPVLSVDGQTGTVVLSSVYAAISHTHELADVDGLVSALAALASDITDLQSDSHAAVTLDQANGLSLDGQELSLALATESTAGAMDSLDKLGLNRQIVPIAGPVLGIKGGVRATHTMTSGSGTTSTNLYTTGSSKKVLIESIMFYNNSGSSRSIDVMWSRGVTDRAIDNTINLSSGSLQNFGGQYLPLLKPADIIKIICSDDDVFVTIRVVELPDTAPIDDFLVTTISSSGTLVSAPSGQTVLLLDQQYRYNPNSGSIRVQNTTGSSIDVKIYIVPSGETAHNRYMVDQQTNINNNQGQSFNRPFGLSSQATLEYSSTVSGTGYFYGVYILTNVN